MSMSDRIMVLSDGKVQQVGTPTDLYQHPSNIFVASFMGHANMLSGDIVKATADGAEDSILIRLDEGVPERHVVTGQLNDNVRGHLNGRARLVFRPEDIRVYAEAREFNHTNVFEGKVSHTSFVGGQWRTLIALDEIRLMQVLAFPIFQPQIEQHLWLEMPPECCQVVPE